MTTLPTIMTMDGTVVEDPKEIIALVLKYYSEIPKHATVNWVNETISLAYTLATYKDSPDVSKLTNAINNDLTQCFNRIFGEPPTVDVTIKPTPIALGETQSKGMDIEINIIINYLGKIINTTGDYFIDKSGKIKYNSLNV